MDNKNVKQRLSKFNLSNEIKTSFEIGQVIPIFWRDTVPGDVWRNNTNLTIRFMPLIAPVMHKIDLHVHFYFTPYRLLDRNFRDILAKPESPLTCPTLYDLGLDSSSNILEQDNLLRAFGIHSIDGTLPIKALKLTSQYFLRAYHLIYNYYYKHELLDDTYVDDMTPDDLTAMGKDLLNIGYARHGFDYFMSSLPNTQYGSMVELDMDGNGQIRVDEMRLAEKLQYFKEQLFVRARGRYKQFLDTFFGTSPTNMELQIPKYLGGGSQTLAVADIDQTASYSVDDTASPLGSQAGKINNDKYGFNFSYRTEEHGIILGLAYVLPRASYVGGVPREFIKTDFYSFYNPTFANLGMQETLGIELSADRSDTFGYNERYAELKHSKDVIAGDFEKLNSWHFGIDLRQEQLSKDFVHVKTDNEPFAVDYYTQRIPVDFNQYNGNDNFFIVHHENGESLLYVRCRDRIGRDLDELVVDFQTNVLPSLLNELYPELNPKWIDINPPYVDVNEPNLIYTNKTGDLSIIPTQLKAGDGVFSGSFSNYDYDVWVFALTSLANDVYYTPSDTTLMVRDGSEWFYKDEKEVIGNHLLLVAYNDCDALRPIPKLAKPSISL